jgi:hypothetical protein
MNDAIADLFDIDVVMKSVRGDDKVLGDCVSGGIVERQVDYMVEACMVMLAGFLVETIRVARLGCCNVGTRVSVSGGM